MSPEEIEVVARELLAPHARRRGRRTEDIGEHEDLFAGGLLDSGDFIGFLMQLEERVGITVDFAAISPQELSTIASIVTLLARPPGPA